MQKFNLKKSIAITLILLVFFLQVQPLLAEEGPQIRIYLDQKELTFDQPPVIVNNRVLVPMRAIFEAFGAAIHWDDSTKSVLAIKDNTAIYLTIGQESATLNKATIKLDVAPQIINGRTMVPLRFIGEALDADVEWKGDEYSVYITSSKKEQATGFEIIGNVIKAGGMTAAQKAAVDERIKSIVDEIITPDMTDYEKELAVHDYIVLNTKYDFENL
ncbi:MAG TPA: hypothetical protein GXX49_04370 [Clostridiaceae bacterium]|nr:hypothetical protein [Clostridiaceae bacterium]